MIVHSNTNNIPSCILLDTANFADEKQNNTSDQDQDNISMNRRFDTNTTATANRGSLPRRAGGDEPPRPESSTAFRRCSLEFTRQNSAKKLSEPKAAVDPASAASSSASRRRPRRSSLKSTATSSTSSTSAASTASSSSSSSPTKFVTFSLDVSVRPIAHKTPTENNACWLSTDERQAIQLQGKADLKTLKAISALPTAVQASDPDIRALRSSISIRGLEQFSSKRLHHALCALQHDHLWSVLEAQEEQRVRHRCYGHSRSARDLAKVSAERSATSRDRAMRQGREDMVAVLGYLGRSSAGVAQHARSPSYSSSGAAVRRSTVGGTSSQHKPPTATASATRPTTTTTTHRLVARRGSMPTISSSEKDLVLKRSPSSTSTLGRQPVSARALHRVQGSFDSLLTRSTTASSSNNTNHNNGHTTSLPSSGGKAINAPGANATFDAFFVNPLTKRMATANPAVNYDAAASSSSSSSYSSYSPTSAAAAPLLEPFVHPRGRSDGGSRRNSA
mmetsp:Transcript_32053/g.94328  ORF Transcript_32053/g.94328 Transcript_32053/m.94328 type:complete len:506 (-) Transcript_32053:160-1677(-)